MKIIISRYKQWKLNRLRKKIDKVFDDLGCDEIFYISSTRELYAIWWNESFARLDEVNYKKDEKIELIEEYRKIKESMCL